MQRCYGCWIIESYYESLLKINCNPNCFLYNPIFFENNPVRLFKMKSSYDCVKCKTKKCIFSLRENSLLVDPLFFPNPKHHSLCCISPRTRVMFQATALIERVQYSVAQSSFITMSSALLLTLSITLLAPKCH